MALTYEITDDGATIKVVAKEGATVHRVVHYNKNNVSITCGIHNDLFEMSDLRASLCIKEGDVLIPAHTDITDLCAQVEAFLITAGGGGGGDATAVNQVTIIGHIDGVARTTAIVNTTGAGTIAVGANRVSIMNDGNSAGLVKGVSIPKGVAFDFEGQLNDTLDAISYDATGTNFIITEVR
jgi:hypothetical protein